MEEIIDIEFNIVSKIVVKQPLRSQPLITSLITSRVVRENVVEFKDEVKKISYISLHDYHYYDYGDYDDNGPFL